MITLTNRQARQFMLLKQGLLGSYRFTGKDGALQFVRQAGCIQFDPIDVCGRNAELTLRSRVDGFTKEMLSELLYTDRKLFDFPDKNLSILPVEDWQYFARYRTAAKQSAAQFPELPELEQAALTYIAENGLVNSDELPIDGSIRWHSAIHWSGGWNGTTNAARAVLEQLYSTGELVIHHKSGNRKYYDLASRHIPASLLNALDPLPEEADHQKWRVLRRIGAVGLLWDRPSDAFLNIWGLKTPQRHACFEQLAAEGKILPVTVEGIRFPLYCRAEDEALLETVLQNEHFAPRCELLAPLDCMLWDRKLIEVLFGFHYQWEIYTPADKRKYGYYVLPMLYGDRFVGRIEATADPKSGTLTVKHIWYEPDTVQTSELSRAIEDCLHRFAAFHACTQLLHQ